MQPVCSAAEPNADLRCPADSASSFPPLQLDSTPVLPRSFSVFEKEPAGGAAARCFSTKSSRVFVRSADLPVGARRMGAQQSKSPGDAETGVERAGEAAATPAKANGQVEEDLRLISAFMSGVEEGVEALRSGSGPCALFLWTTECSTVDSAFLHNSLQLHSPGSASVLTVLVLLGQTEGSERSRKGGCGAQRAVRHGALGARFTESQGAGSVHLRVWCHAGSALRSAQLVFRSLLLLLSALGTANSQNGFLFCSRRTGTSK